MLAWDLMTNYRMQLMILWISPWCILDVWYALNIPEILYVQCLSHKSLQNFSPISSTNFRYPHFGHPDHSGTPCWSKKTSLRAQTRSFWEQVRSDFWRSTPQNKAFSKQNKGHFLGSRYNGIYTLVAEAICLGQNSKPWALQTYMLRGVLW